MANGRRAVYREVVREREEVVEVCDGFRNVLEHDIENCGYVVPSSGLFRKWMKNKIEAIPSEDRTSFRTELSRTFEDEVRDNISSINFDIANYND